MNGMNIQFHIDIGTSHTFFTSKVKLLNYWNTISIRITNPPSPQPKEKLLEISPVQLKESTLKGDIVEDYVQIVPAVEVLGPIQNYSM